MVIKKKILLVILFLSISINALPWGFWGHKRINRVAVFTLPEGMLAFYKYHIEYITKSAVNPDRRRYATKNEAPRHYIDVDHYGEYPFDNVPRRWKDAVEKLTEDTLQAYGIVPWHVEKMTYRLTKAFEEMDGGKILRLSADLGHYIADAHVPLHTTENYNGQFTNQKGIHGFWESRVPELLGEEYDYFVGKATYIDNPLDKIWQVVLKSHSMLDSVLTFEKKLSESYPSDQKYSYEKRGASTLRVYSEDFSNAYNQQLNNMAERRMRASIIDIGSFWLTAWVNAGQPDLTPLLGKKFEDDIKKDLEEIKKDSLQVTKKIYGREHAKTGLE